MATPSPQPPLFPLLFAAAPIGVFDSGIGGLSVLRALRAQLPHERFVYFADSAHAPYGERGEAFVLQRSLHIAAQLQAQHHIKALVVACNTATAAAVRTLRSKAPDLPLVGIEPAIKPAAALTQTGRVGVVATRGTIESDKLARLIALHGGRKARRFRVQPDAQHGVVAGAGAVQQVKKSHGHGRRFLRSR